MVNKYAGIHLATDEDLERDFPDGFVIGFPVRPSDDDERDEQLPAESDSQQG
jgi:hypothetical protein